MWHSFAGREGHLGTVPLFPRDPTALDSPNVGIIEVAISVSSADNISFFRGALSEGVIGKGNSTFRQVQGPNVSRATSCDILGRKIGSSAMWEFRSLVVCDIAKWPSTYTVPGHKFPPPPSLSRISFFSRASLEFLRRRLMLCSGGGEQSGEAGFTQFP